MGGQNGEVDKVVARLATKAHGVVARRELLAARLTERHVDRRLERGALFVEFTGVYRGEVVKVVPRLVSRRREGVW